jgi:hypothetical protein
MLGNQLPHNARQTASPLPRKTPVKRMQQTRIGHRFSISVCILITTSRSRPTAVRLTTDSVDLDVYQYIY